MNVLYRIVLFLMLLTGAGPVRAQVDFCNATNISFQAGEKLNFKVYYNMSRLWIGAGVVQFAVNQARLHGRDMFHIVGTGRTLSSYDWFFRVRDKYESYVDQATLLPAKFVRNVDEGGYRIFNNVSFNHSTGQAVSTGGIFPVPRCVQDVLSAIYYARNIDYNQYKPGAKIPFSMFLDDKVYNLYIRYQGKERITTSYGTFNAIRISPLLIEGTIFKGGEQMVIWVTDDANHMPIRIDSPILVGSIKVDLVGFQNLKNPLTSLVKKK